MIDFAKITKTVSGLDCYYLGQRRSAGQVLHRFAVVNSTSEMICYYNDQGQRIDFSGAGGWLVCNKGHEIIAPPKIVEVTQYVGLLANSHGDYYTLAAKEKEQLAPYNCLSIEQKTFRFEVPNDS